MNDVSIALREDSRGEAHTRVSVFVGRRKGSRGHSGQLTFRTDEWDELKVMKAIEFDLLMPLEIQRKEAL